MKYFTKEMWTGLNDKRKCKRLKKKWENSIVEYEKQFEGLKNRIGLANFDFFKKYSLHDSKLISLELLDMNNNNGLSKVLLKQPTCVTIKISSGYNEGIFIIEYQNVITLNINYSVNNQLFKNICDGLGNIGYDEITKLENNFIKQEFLFSTGSSIEIVFGKIKAYVLK
jgi:hypothetical protein